MDLASSLRVFARIIETGSMTAAARELGIGQPAASKLLRKLESHCGAPLLVRSPRGMRPTAEGVRLHEASGAAMSTIDAAIEEVRSSGASVRGSLRVHSPFCLGERRLHRIASEFRERHPAVAIELMLGNNGIDLVRENVDLAFGLRQPRGGGIVQRKVGIARRALVASPAYVARNGAPGRPEELRDHDLAVTDASLSADDELVLEGPDGEVSLRLAPVLRTNSVETLRRTLLEGRAIGTAQIMLVSEDLAAGRLLRVLPDHEIRPSQIYLSYPQARLMRPVVRAFIDFAVPAVRQIEGVE